MKKIIPLIFVFLSISCNKKVEYKVIEKPLKKVNYKKNDLGQKIIVLDKAKLTNVCGSGFQINHKASVGTSLINELKQYLHKSLINNELCLDLSFSDNLFKSNLFKQSIIFIYTDDDFLKSGIYDYESRWKEKYLNLLNNCKDIKVQNEIINELLAINVSDVLILFFDRELPFLSNLGLYTEKNRDNFYKMSLLYTLAHIDNDNELKEKTKQHIISSKNYDEESFFRLEDLLKTKDKFDYLEYIETLYGGV